VWGQDLSGYSTVCGLGMSGYCAVWGLYASGYDTVGESRYEWL